MTRYTLEYGNFFFLAFVHELRDYIFSILVVIIFCFFCMLPCHIVPIYNINYAFVVRLIGS